MAHEKISTADHLEWTHPHKCLSPRCCSLCRGNEESVGHLFLFCPFVHRIWDKWREFTQLDVGDPTSCRDLFSQGTYMIYTSFPSSWLKVWRVVVLIVIWSVWVERNNWIFENKGRDVQGILDLSHFRASFWIAGSKLSKGLWESG